MSSIAGFFTPECRREERIHTLEARAEHMLKRLSHRGPDAAYRMTTPDGILMGNLFHTNTLSKAIVPTQGKGSLSHLYIVYEDGIYNYDHLRAQLEGQNICTKGLNRPEILLYLYHIYGERFASILQGGFSIAIMDTRFHKVCLFRDPLGIKPLFYQQQGDAFIFASEIKGIFAYKDTPVVMDLRGMHQIFSLGPAHVPGTTPYRNIHEVRPGKCITFSNGRISENSFWHLQALRHEESYEETIEHARHLLMDATRRQLHKENANCCLLSGGLDSSVVTAFVQRECGNEESLKTYSFDFTDSQKYFSSNAFQPSLDHPFVVSMAEHFHTNHSFLECNTQNQVSLLGQTVIAHDGPCMADISSSLFYFCKQVGKYSRVAFTGECADELFGGYPWYHKEPMRSINTFPWSMDLGPRRLLLSESFLQKLGMEHYLSTVYDNCCNNISYLPEDSPENRQHRRLYTLTTQYFMQTLIDRMDRAACYGNISAICPFADIKLAEYLYNVPWEMKTKDGEVKHILRQIAKPLLPSTISQRKKSPYPKNYNPEYEQMLCKEMLKVLRQPNHPINDFIDPEKTYHFCTSPKDYGKPWYGQLMAGPQLLAYYLQIDYWLQHYHVEYQL